MKLSREQLQSRKDRAVQFTRDVLGDSERSAEIADEPLESYAQRRKIQLTNNPRGGRYCMPTKEELEDRIAELEQENEDLQSQLDDIADIVAPSEDEDGDQNGSGYDDEDD